MFFKVTTLHCYRKGGAGDYYYSIQSMIQYEQDHNLLNSKDRQSGARTLLRLHRALGKVKEIYMNAIKNKNKLYN